MCFAALGRPARPGAAFDRRPTPEIDHLSTARAFYSQLRFVGIVQVFGRDTHADGRGRMLIRRLDIVTVGDGTGDGCDIGERVNYLTTPS